MSAFNAVRRSRLWSFHLVTCSLLLLPCATFAQDSADLAELVETRDKVPILKAAVPYEMKDGVVEIELSEYAGYAGLIAANGGLDPSDDSHFAKHHGFKVKLTLSEEESWSALNSGKLAGSATTVDVLAAYGSQFKVKVPALIGFSRGATGLVVRKDVKTINDLKGKILPVCQFTEGDFLIRYLAQEAGLGIMQLGDPPWKPAPDKVNLVFCADGFGAGDIFERDVRKKLNLFAGCVTWDPKTGEVADACKDDAYVLTTTANLLVVADVLILNDGFAKANPKIVAGLVDGLLAGNAMVRAEPARHAAAIEKAFGWEAGDAVTELKKVHLANYPENDAFFNGTIDAAGSFKYLFETATALYRPQLAASPVSGDTVLSLDALNAAGASGAFKDQRADIKPIKLAVDLGESSAEEAETSLLSKNVRIEFMPNSAEVDADKNGSNKTAMEKIVSLMRVSPGSVVLLRGHADNLKLEEYKKKPDHDPKKVRDGELRLKALSEERCNAVKKLLMGTHKAEAGRVRVEGVGVSEATGDPEFDRRVEVQWFTK